MKQRLLAMMVAGVALAGCQTNPSLEQARSENERLEAELRQAKAKIERLEQREVRMSDEIAELNRVMNVLDAEKSKRVEESSQLRGQVRRFVQNQIDEFKQFMVRGDLLDYVGSELVERARLDEEPLLLVDMDHPMPSDGSITGVSAHFAKPGVFTVQVMRPVEDELMVIWQSDTLEATASGVQRINFPVSVGVEQGDYIAYRPLSAGMISFDEGTGDTRYRDEAVSLGRAVSVDDLDGAEQKRSYSVGVYGLLN